MKKLNLGARQTEIDGYIAIDRVIGSEAYPLQCDDESAEEIRASHILEHFSHTQVADVVKHWVSKLVPGGALKIAVPNFLMVAREYLAGKPINTMGYVCGGHVDGNDIHGAVFDEELLTELMVNAGLERIGHWTSEIQDCAALPISLNLVGYKPAATIDKIENTVAVLATARFGPAMHHQCAYTAFQRLGIPYWVHSGCFWEQLISEQMERAIADPSVEYVITGDFDSVFTEHDVRELYRLMRAYNADAIAPLQSKRSGDSPLFCITDESGKIIQRTYKSIFERNLTQVSTAHFGLTIFNAAKLRALPRPWMRAEPNADGRWSEGKRDYDITFWDRWKEAGNAIYLANRVVIGHMAELLMWPGGDYKPIYQTLDDYARNGIPAGAMR